MSEFRISIKNLFFTMLIPPVGTVPHGLSRGLITFNVTGEPP